MALQQPTVFFMRRYSLIFLMLMWPENRLLHINSFINFAILKCIYTMYVKPHDNTSFNNQEIVNDMIVLLSGYVLFQYTEIVWDAETRYYVGWWHACIIALSFIANMLFMIPAMIHITMLSVKKRMSKHILKKRARVLE